MRGRRLRIVGWALAVFALVLVVDLLIPRAPFRFLGEFGFERGPTSTHGFNVGSYRTRPDWDAVVRRARAELESDGFKEVPGDERLTFRRGSGEGAATVYLARDVRTAEVPIRFLTAKSPGWVAVYVKGIDQSKLLGKLLSLFGL